MAITEPNLVFNVGKPYSFLNQDGSAAFRDPECSFQMVPLSLSPSRAVSVKVGAVMLLLLGLTGCLSKSERPQVTGNEYGASVSLKQEEASAAISALLDGDFGRALKPSDHKAVAEAQEQALRTRGTGVAIGWSNSRTGHRGEVRPGPVYQVNLTTCREVVHDMMSEDRRLTWRSTACLDEAGGWRILPQG